MSLIGERVAIISLGISCQTAYQIRLHKDLLSALMGENFQVKRMPFDWFIMPLASGVSFLSSGFPLPESPSELEVGRLNSNTIAWYPRGGFYFYHDFHSEDGSRLDFERNFAATIDAYSRRWEAFLQLRSLDRRIFIISNTQNNLYFNIHSSDGVDLFITEARLEQMQTALDSIFPGTNEILVVSDPDRLTLGASTSRWAPVVMEPSPISADWFGDAQSWRAVFIKWFT